MRRASRIPALAGAALGVLAIAVPGAAWARGLELDPAGSQTFPERAYALHTPADGTLDAGAVTVTENGDPVSDVTLSSAAEATHDSFATVLVIDASNSMRGRPIVEAMRAARAFAQRRAPSQELAAITFSDRPRVLLSPTTDEERIDAALAGTPALHRATHLYDAVGAAVGLLDDAGIRAGSIVVLSDGADTGSAAGAAGVIARAHAAGVRVFTVGLHSGGFDPAQLRRLAASGVYANARDPEDLRLIFRRFGARLASDYLLSYRSTARPGEPVTVEVTVDGIGSAADRYAVPRTQGAGSGGAEESFWTSRAAMMIVIAVAAGLLGVAIFVLIRPRQETVRQRLSRFLAHQPGRASSTPAASPQHGAAGGILAPVERWLGGRGWWERFCEDLEIARLGLPAPQVVAMTFLGTVLAALVFGSAMGIPVLVPLCLLVPLGVRLTINRRLRAQREEFGEQLADNLQMVASALRAGQSMVGAFAVVIEQAPEPSRTEFRGIVSDERVGVPLDDAISTVARRMESRDLDQLALVAKIQRETGGNTAEVIDQLIATIRERAALRRLMKTLTAQGRLTQGIVSVLPLALLLGISVLQPDYMEPLFQTGAGRIALGIGVGLSIVGSLIIRRVVAVRV